MSNKLDGGKDVWVWVLMGRGIWGLDVRCWVSVHKWAWKEVRERGMKLFIKRALKSVMFSAVINRVRNVQRDESKSLIKAMEETYKRFEHQSNERNVINPSTGPKFL